MIGVGLIELGVNCRFVACGTSVDRVSVPPAMRKPATATRATQATFHVREMCNCSARGAAAKQVGLMTDVAGVPVGLRVAELLGPAADAGNQNR